jgi:hypothetical protein
MLQRIADGRTDSVFDYLAQGHVADSVDGGGVSLIQWCATTAMSIDAVSP